jgi:hypothetical protein
MYWFVIVGQTGRNFLLKEGIHFLIISITFSIIKKSIFGTYVVVLKNILGHADVGQILVCLRWQMQMM